MQHGNSYRYQVALSSYTSIGRVLHIKATNIGEISFIFVTGKYHISIHPSIRFQQIVYLVDDYVNSTGCS